MIIEPRIRGFLCTTAHPAGCAAQVGEQINYVTSQGSVPGGPTKVLILGSSTGYGLSSRIVAAFGCRAATLGVAFERPAERGRTATAGWYQNIAFEDAAHASGLYAKTLNGDAFSEEMKEKVIATLREDLGQVDMVIYSLAAPRRTHPKTGETFKSVLKPIGKGYTNKSIDSNTGQVAPVSLEPATEDDVRQTVAVMGGEDWEMWIEALREGGVLSPTVTTLAYSYIGPEVTRPIYRNGTIGAAKDHLEKTARKLNAELEKTGGRAYISVNKALVTQSSSAIPFIPLYINLLYKVMKEKGLHEGCLEQMYRLFKSKLYAGAPIPVDEENRIRMDEWENRSDVQSEVERLWAEVSSDNVNALGDLSGYREDFLRLYGFGLAGVNYGQDYNLEEL